MKLLVLLTQSIQHYAYLQIYYSKILYHIPLDLLLILVYSLTHQTKRRICLESSFVTIATKTSKLVEIGGFEPPTSAMRTQRSPN